VSDATLYSRVLVDTGPLVAILNATDQHHTRCVETLKRIRPPLLTTWAVLTEAVWLLRPDARAVCALYRAAGEGLYAIAEITQDELADIDRLHHRYRDLAPQLADLMLLHVARREGLETIFTLDRRDFSVFRRKGKGAFRLLPEE
jgi:predicted nucleic acid-binding protein